MRRISINKRPRWEDTVAEQGLLFHTAGGIPYWDEGAYYVFASDQIDRLERVTAELNEMCINAVGHVIANKRYAALGIPASAVPYIEHTWEQETPALYDRFDFAWDGNGEPKLLEYNADTPTSLLEAAAIQWLWLKDTLPGFDQFNSLEPKLVAKWKQLIGHPYLFPGPIHFAHDGGLEDRMTVGYLMKTAMDAIAELRSDGVRVDREIIELQMFQIGWNPDARCFMDLSDQPITNIFKLYPWETMFAQQFAPHLLTTRTHMHWMEPAWNLVLASKGLLPILWELYPDHPNLLPAYFDGPRGLSTYARKPLLSREGANVTLVQNGNVLEKTAGPCGGEGYIYQGLALLPNFDGNHPVIGSWLIDGEPAGMGIRESKTLVTDDRSRFVPHAIDLAL